VRCLAALAGFWAVGKRMSNPTRDKWVNIKVTEQERTNWKAFAESQGYTVADLFRLLIANAAAQPSKLHKKQRRKTRKADPELLRELAKIGNNLNQIAKWANTYKSEADAVQVVQALIAIERALPEKN